MGDGRLRQLQSAFVDTRLRAVDRHPRHPAGRARAPRSRGLRRRGVCSPETPGSTSGASTSSATTSPSIPRTASGWCPTPPPHSTPGTTTDSWMPDHRAGSVAIDRRRSPGGRGRWPRASTASSATRTAVRSRCAAVGPTRRGGSDVKSVRSSPRRRDHRGQPERGQSPSGDDHDSATRVVACRVIRRPSAVLKRASITTARLPWSAPPAGFEPATHGLEGPQH